MIPADRIRIDGNEAWLIIDAWSQGAGAPGLYDRPCETYGCDGGIIRQMGRRDGEKCPDCIDGRYTFDIEVECHHDCRRFGGKVPGHARGSNWDWVPCWCDGTFVLTYRVSIVPGMVLPIKAADEEVETAWMTHIAPYHDRGWHIWHGEDTHAATPRWKIEPINLPPAAAPGMYAVLLKVAT